MAVCVGRHSCVVPGKDPPQLPFLTGDGKFPIVSKYGLSILLDTAIRQSLTTHQSDLAQKMEPICFPGNKGYNKSAHICRGSTEKQLASAFWWNLGKKLQSG